MAPNENVGGPQIKVRPHIFSTSGAIVPAPCQGVSLFLLNMNITYKVFAVERWWSSSEFLPG